MENSAFKCPSKLCTYSNVYLFFLSLIGILQGAYFTYFIGVLSTLEKRYAFDTSITGVILIADNISPALLSVIIGYYGKIVHRPKFLTYGMGVTVFSCFLCTLPYCIFRHNSRNVKSVNHASFVQDENLCGSYQNKTSLKCEEEILFESYFAVTVLFVANFLNGCGSAVLYTIGTSYLDDSVTKAKSPIYLGTFFSLRMIGPTLGFMLSAACLKLYEKPFGDPGFSDKDPRWIGCWWLGFLILGISIALASCPISFLPKHIHHLNCESDANKVDELPSQRHIFSDVISSSKKLLKNAIFVFHALSIIFQINGIYGYMTFMPKYIENQYKKSASGASFFSGTTKLLTLIGGVVMSSIIIQKLKPSPMCLTGYMFFVAVFSLTGVISAFFLGCSSPSAFGHSDGIFSLDYDCNKDCGCLQNAYFPVCSPDGIEYFSPCHAGCSSSVMTNDTKEFSSCSCIDSDYAISGQCSYVCDTFIIYFSILTLSSVLTSTTRVSKVLVTLRCGDDKEKSFTLGTMEFLISVLATIPYPLAYGYAIDNSCLLWEENCGRRGNCLYYDDKKYRLNYHTLSSTFLVCGCICEAIVFALSKQLNHFYVDSTVASKNPSEDDETLL